MTRFILPFFCLLVTTGVWSHVIHFNEEFTTSLMKILAKKGANMMISPINMESALGVIGFGAEGETADELFTTLGYQTDQAEEAISMKESLLNENPSPGVTRNSFNRILVSSMFPLSDSYVKAIRHAFPQFEISNFNFIPPEKTADEINSWVSDKTQNEIENFVDAGSVGSNAAIINLNAIYFKGNWKNSFDKEQTKQDCFFPSVSKCLLTDLMRQESSFKYDYNDSSNTRIIELPYMDEGYSMVLVMPDPYTDFNTFMASLNVDDILVKVNSLENKNVDVILPRFEMKFNQEMRSTLEYTGMRTLFSWLADLSKMSIKGEQIKGSRVFHGGKLRCREEGTVSSAGTGVKCVNKLVDDTIESSDVKDTKQSSKPELETKERFWAINPFLYMIRGKAGVLFSGVYSTPPEKN